MTTPPSPDEYGTDRTINVVDDLGWATDASKRVSKPPGDDGLTVEAPPGRYLVGDRWDYPELNNWCFRSTTGNPDDVVFVVEKGRITTLFNIRAGDWCLANFTLDQREDWESALGLKAHGANWVISGVHYKGWRPNENEGSTSALTCYAKDPDGTCYIHDFYADERVSLAEYPDNTLMMFSGKESVGDIYVLDCEMENSGEHAIYASRTTGDVRIERCVFRNNQNTQVRIAGEGSYCKDSTFIWDDGHDNRGEFEAQTGLTFEAGFQGYAGGLVEGCGFFCYSSAPNSGCLKVDGSHGAVTVRDCTFRVDADDAEPIWVDAPGDSHMIDGLPDKPWDVQLENVTIEGAGGWTHKKWHDVQHTAAVRIAGRSGSTIRDSSVTMPHRDGVRFVDGDYTLDGVEIDVGGEAVITQNATVSREHEETMESYAHHLRVIAPDDDVVEYEIDTSGAARLVTEGEMAASSDGESITEHDDGSSTATGICARGGGDTFEFDGEVTDVRVVSGPDPTVEVDGEALDLAQFREHLSPTERNEVRAIARTVVDEQVAPRRSDDEITTLAREVARTHIETALEAVRGAFK